MPIVRAGDAGPGVRVAAHGTAMVPRRYDPVGTVEIAERLGVTRQAVDKWRARRVGFPAPVGRVGGRPAWDWTDIEAWARETGRLT